MTTSPPAQNIYCECTYELVRSLNKYVEVDMWREQIWLSVNTREEGINKGFCLIVQFCCLHHYYCYLLVQLNTYTLEALGGELCLLEV